MDSLFREFDSPSTRRGGERYWPAVNLYDNGESLIVLSTVPGLKEEDISITTHGDVVTISGERKIDPPEGYSVHRLERPSFKFSRSFLVPVKVDYDKTVATLKDGILTVMLPKSPEAQPKRISIKAG
jgi:HSP20 family protein